MKTKDEVTSMDQKIKPGNRRRTFLWIALWLLCLGLLGVVLVYLLWVRPNLSKPLSASLDLSTGQTEAAPLSLDQPLDPGTGTPGNGTAPALPASGDPVTPQSPVEVPAYIAPTIPPGKEPVCGDDAEWMVLLVGVDYLGDDYLYGLADVIRLARIDFVNLTVNMVALPRDLIVQIPEGRLVNIEDPIKLNQAYLFGTMGMGHYKGSGYGAGSLAEVIQYNFGVSADHYGVINFVTFVKFIDTIGGIEVDLPNYVDDRPQAFFPAGKQTLSGSQALSLARIRMKYSDAFRVNNQTLILQAVVRRLLQPENLVRIPKLVDEFKGSALTDLSLEQISTLVCFAQKFDTANLRTYSVPEELIRSDRAYIPTLSDESFVYRWDVSLIDWLHASLITE